MTTPEEPAPRDGRGPGDVPWAAVVLAGGTSSRWGGRDKTATSLARRPLLLHAVEAVLPEATALAVVAPPGHPARLAVEQAAAAAGRPLVWTREEPPGGGPLAGLAAGVAALPAEPARRAVVVLAGDLPFARTARPRLLAALTADRGAEAGAEVDAAVGVDADGHRQPLLAAYAEGPLRAALAGLPVDGRPLRALLAGLRVAEVPVSAREALDLDTPADAEQAAALLSAEPPASC